MPDTVWLPPAATHWPLWVAAATVMSVDLELWRTWPDDPDPRAMIRRHRTRTPGRRA